MPVIRLTALLFLVASSLAAQAEPSVSVDETALRWYARHGYSERLDAEMRRLRTLYPEWEPPTDLTSPQSFDETPLWALFAGDDIEAVEAAMQARRRIEPGFRPSDDLAAKLQQRRARRTMLQAAAASRPQDVLATAARMPELVGCHDLEASWTIAAAWRAKGDEGRAVAIFGDLLDACQRPQDRRALVDTAVPTLGWRVTAALIAKVRLRQPSAVPVSVEAPVTRAGVAEALAVPGTAAPHPVAIEAWLSSIEPSAPADELALAAWWTRATGDHARSLGLFEAASTRSIGRPDPKTVEGIALGLEALGRRDEALAIASDNADRSEPLGRLAVDLGSVRFSGKPRPRLDDREIAAYAAATTRWRSAPGAETLGWYAYDFGQTEAARRWFETGLGWRPSRGLALGHVLATARLGAKAEAQRLLVAYASEFPDLTAVKLGGTAVAVVRDAAGVALAARDYRGCLRHIEARSGRGLKPADAIMKGWCLVGLERPAEAAAAFEAGMGGSPTQREEAAYGRSIAALRAGRPDLADRTGAIAPQRRRDIDGALLGEEAAAAYRAGQWGRTLALLDQRAGLLPESRDLSLLRGWTLDHLGRREAAEAIFTALDRSLSTPESQQAVAAMAARRERGN
jgi:tetratricopeptide (TPR) repeat protein